MIYWIILGILVFLALFFLKMKRFQHRFFALFVILFLIFLFVSGYRVINQANVDITTAEGIYKISSLYFGWLAQVVGNVISITGEVISMDWTGNLTRGG